MTRPVLLILSTDAPAPDVFARPIGRGELTPLRQDRLTDEAIRAARGLITSVSVDQIDLHDKRAALRDFLDSGGRWVFNGHMVRPLVEGVGLFVPLERPRRVHYVLTRLAEHPVFAGIPAGQLEANRGVAGFYGRGHNLPPEGALRITGLGPDRVPVDWCWHRPEGGALFMHAGNDLWGVGDDPAVKRQIAERLAAWCREAAAERLSA